MSFRILPAAGLFLCLASLAAADFQIVSTTSNTRNYRVVWNSQQSEYLSVFAEGGVVLAQRLNAWGAPIGSYIIPTEAPAYSEADVVYNPDRNEYMLVVFDNGMLPWPPFPPPPRTPSVVGVVLNGNGLRTGVSFQIMSGSRYTLEDGPTLRVAYNSISKEYLVAAQLASGTNGKIFTRRVLVTGTPTGAVNELNTWPINLTSLSLAYVPVPIVGYGSGYYLVAYCTTQDVYVNMLDAGGAYAHTLDPDALDGNAEYRPEIVYGGMLADGSGIPYCLLVWEDRNNKDIWNPDQIWAGVWSTYIRADNPWSDSNRPARPVTKLWYDLHQFLDWRPQVAYCASAQAFLVVWRETPVESPPPVDMPLQYHIRGCWVDNAYWLVSPHNNFVISQATGTWPGVEQPEHPAVAAASDANLLVTWDDNRNAGSGKQRDLYGSIVTHSPNDPCGSAIAIGPGWYFGTLVGATDDGSASCGGAGQPDAWYSYTAPQAGTLKVSTCGTNDFGGIDAGMDTVLSVHSGCPGTSTNQLACNDDWPSGPDPNACNGIWPFIDAGSLRRDSALSLPVTPGQTVWIRVSKFWASTPGFFYLTLGLEPGTPADFDDDSDVDLVDFGVFQGCFNGPNRPYAQTNCADVDFDHDNDVDLVDFGVFQGCFNGPNRPPACP
jgi:hypothetical protein